MGWRGARSWREAVGRVGTASLQVWADALLLGLLALGTTAAIFEVHFQQSSGGSQAMSRAERADMAPSEALLKIRDPADLCISTPREPEQHARITPELARR